jgi:hypothetical protein
MTGLKGGNARSWEQRRLCDCRLHLIVFQLTAVMKHGSQYHWLDRTLGLSRKNKETTPSRGRR